VKQNEALLRAIIQQPEEDTPRLAYADWLDENGDADRAEFIRVQCEVTSLPTSDPRRPDLLTRERELLDRHSWAWAEGLAPRVSEWQFRRGFVERVETSLETDRDTIAALLQKAPIRHLRDTGQFCDLSGVVAALPDLAGLTGLEFWGLYAFENTLLGTILTSPHLRSLRTLILHHDRNGNTADEDVIADAMLSPHLANIEELAVNVDGMWRGPSRKILQVIASSPHLRKLRCLNLTNAGDEGNEPRMDLKTLRSLGKSPNLASLEELDLGNTSFSLKGWDEVLKWPFLPRLKWLRLHYARQVNPPSVMTVAQIADVPKYRRAFEKLVANIDWETDFITPYDGNAGWKGQSWDEFHRRHLFGMWPFVQKRDYGGLEEAYRADCVKHAGEAAAKAVDDLPFNRYQTALTTGLKRAIAGCDAENATAIYLRIRPDIQWDGKYHVSNAVVANAFEPHEEYSYSGPVTEFDAPSFPEAAGVRDEYRDRKPLDPGGVRHYLLARTVAAFGRCLARNKAPVPVYFSCMYAVFRM
jgi:uncharacterized protein (TIGR02996 family)